MSDFFSGVNLIYLITLLTTAIGAVYGYNKYRYEKKLEKFKETNANLFTEKKQEVLAAIATLSLFKKDKDFEKNTIDVLLSRLYTELDYDIINAITSTLIQDSDRDELLHIANGILDINRNFFVQDTPIKQRIHDLKKLSPKTPAGEGDSLPDDTLKGPGTMYDVYSKEVFDECKKEFLSLFPKESYQLLWHKQITADAYAMFIRKAFLQNSKQDLEVNMYQNDFNYNYMAQFQASSCKIWRSAVGSGYIVDVGFDRVDIFRTDFYNSKFHRCNISNGKIDKSSFSTNKFEDVTFSGVEFSNTDFQYCNFSNTHFFNCKGLKPVHFYKSKISNDSDLPKGITVEDVYAVRAIDAIAEVMQSAIGEAAKKEMVKQIAKPESIELLFDYYDSSFSDSEKALFIREHSLKFSVAEILLYVMNFGKDEKEKADLIKLCLAADTGDIIIEGMASAGLDNYQMKKALLAVNNNLGLQQWLDYTAKSKLSGKEKEEMANRLSTIFA